MTTQLNDQLYFEEKKCEIEEFPLELHFKSDVIIDCASEWHQKIVRPDFKFISSDMWRDTYVSGLS